MNSSMTDCLIESYYFKIKIDLSSHESKRLLIKLSVYLFKDNEKLTEYYYLLLILKKNSILSLNIAMQYVYQLNNKLYIQ